jgi:putative transposase
MGAALKHGLAIHAYVWMIDRIHLLATPEFDDSISKIFQSVGRKYVQYSTMRTSAAVLVGKALPQHGGGQRTC